MGSLEALLTTSPTQSSAEPSKKLYVLEFWAVVFVPWILDLLGPHAVFASVFGAVAWGLAVALAVALIRTRDLKAKKALGTSLIVVSVVWLLYWFVSFFEVQRASSTLSGLPKWLMLTHAGLLAAGAGMVLLNLASSFLWLVQNVNLRKTSWERRSGQRFALPNLEALGKVSGVSVELALGSWGLGFFIAILNGILSWSHQQGLHLGWMRDPKVIVTAGLWLLLAAVFQLGHAYPKTSRKLFISYCLLSTIFLVGFFGLLIFNRATELHEPINWFIR